MCIRDSIKVNGVEVSVVNVASEADVAEVINGIFGDSGNGEQNV